MSNDVLRAGRPGVRIPAEARDVSLFQKSIPALGPTQHHIRWEPGSFQGDAVAVREVGYSSPYSAQAKNECSHTSTPHPPYAFTALTGTTSTFVHRGKEDRFFSK